MMRVSLPQDEIIMDPLNGVTYSKDELQAILDPYLDAKGYRGETTPPLNIFLHAPSSREILSRFLRSLKLIYTEHECWERLVILLPDSIEEVRDRGLIFAQLEYLHPAIKNM